VRSIYSRRKFALGLIGFCFLMLFSPLSAEAGGQRPHLFQYNLRPHFSSVRRLFCQIRLLVGSGQAHRLKCFILHPVWLWMPPAMNSSGWEKGWI
jgi:hypothetical protein